MEFGIDFRLPSDMVWSLWRYAKGNEVRGETLGFDPLPGHEKCMFGQGTLHMCSFLPRM